MKIVSLFAQEILDSRGSPTIQAKTVLSDGSEGWSAVPSGASTGKYEAVELRDGDKKRYNGLGVMTAVRNIEKTIAKAVKGIDAADQKKLDETMIALDNTENKEHLGANAILAVSLCAARAQAISEKKSLYQYLTKFNPDFTGSFLMPIPQMNVLNGGKHGNWSTDIQEYMLEPIGAATISDAIRMCAEVYFHLKQVLKKRGFPISVGDEGGFAPQFSSNAEPFEVLKHAIEIAGYVLGKDFALAIDSAASEFYHKGFYTLSKEGKTLDRIGLGKFYAELAKEYPIISMEDIFAEDDWEGFQAFTRKQGSSVQIVGDDLYVTNVKRLKRGIEEKSSNAILIKLNQIGTLTETISAVLLARKHHMHSIISHRSGETEDTFIADFAVAMGTGQIKTGAPCRSERTAKYNRLLTIEKELGKKARYAVFPKQ